MSYNSRHKWSELIIDPNGNYFKCVKCGAKKKNIYLGYGKNGRAALYFLPSGERTSFNPPCLSDEICTGAEGSDTTMMTIERDDDKQKNNLSIMTSKQLSNLEDLLINLEEYMEEKADADWICKDIDGKVIGNEEMNLLVRIQEVREYFKTNSLKIKS